MSAEESAALYEQFLATHGGDRAYVGLAPMAPPGACGCLAGAGAGRGAL